MNELIQKVAELGLSQTIYYVFHVLGFAAVFLFVVWFGKKMDIRPLKSVLVVLTVYPIIYLWMYILCWIETGFSGFGGNNIVRVFIYVPLAGYPVAKWLKIRWDKICSLLAFAPTMVHAVSHLGCIFPGCCYGYPSSWGLYHVGTEMIRFPSQPIESLITWLIIGYLLIRAKKKSYVPDGLEFPIMLALFGSTRFICEFFRDNPKIWLGCSSLAFHALFMAVVGVVMIIVILAKRKNRAAEADSIEQQNAAEPAC